MILGSVDYVQYALGTHLKNRGLCSINVRRCTQRNKGLCICSVLTCKTSTAIKLVRGIGKQFQLCSSVDEPLDTL